MVVVRNAAQPFIDFLFRRQMAQGKTESRLFYRKANGRIDSINGSLKEGMRLNLLSLEAQTESEGFLKRKIRGKWVKLLLRWQKP